MRRTRFGPRRLKKLREALSSMLLLYSHNGWPLSSWVQRPVVVVVLLKPYCEKKQKTFFFQASGPHPNGRKKVSLLHFWGLDTENIFSHAYLYLSLLFALEDRLTNLATHAFFKTFFFFFDPFSCCSKYLGNITRREITFLLPKNIMAIIDLSTRQK